MNIFNIINGYTLLLYETQYVNSWLAIITFILLGILGEANCGFPRSRFNLKNRYQQFNCFIYVHMNK